MSVIFPNASRTKLEGPKVLKLEVISSYKVQGMILPKDQSFWLKLGTVVGRDPVI